MGDKPFWYGLEEIQLSGELAGIFNLPQHVGLLVQKIVPLTPADITGIKSGVYEANIEGQMVILDRDIILAINNIELDLGEIMDKIVDQLASLKPGDTFMLMVFRAGKKEVLKSIVP
ncbi:MAG: PDZ domain-containing protein [Flammeovirgaceae bacterium]|nr:PDZ domain-containing protein [Flammeovirgaceae bacterium]